MKEFIIIFSVFILCFIFINLYKYYLHNKCISNIISTLEGMLSKEDLDYKINIVKRKEYDIIIELNDTIYLIKIIRVPSKHEVVITNRTTWILRAKSGEESIKNRIKGIKSFINCTYNTSLNVKKIALVYPNSRNILKYINENEMIIVTPNMDIFGCNIILFNDLIKNNVKIF